MNIDIGLVLQTKNSGPCAIIEKLRERIKVKFNDSYGHEMWVDSNAVHTGAIKNPYTPKIFGVGYFGAGPYKAREGSSRSGVKQTPEYVGGLICYHAATIRTMLTVLCIIIALSALNGITFKILRNGALTKLH